MSIPCLVANMDLLGYGALLQAASANIDHPVGKQAVERIRQFHTQVQEAGQAKGLEAVS